MTPEQQAALERARQKIAAPKMTPEQSAAVERARARVSSGNGEAMKARIAAAKAGTLKSDPAKQAEIDALGMEEMRASTPLGYRIGDNIWGADDGYETAGERIGADLNDMGKATGAGVARGTAALAGLPGTLGDLIDAGVTGGINYLAGSTLAAPKSTLSGERMAGGMSAATGGATDYRGETLGGRFAGTIGEFLPGAAAFGGMSAGNLLRFGAAPGAASEAAGMATEGTAWEPWARAGAALAAPMALGGANWAIRKAISPHGGADPARLAMASTLDDAGIPVTAGQRVGSEAMRRKEGWTQAGQDLMEAQGDAFTRAALRTVGTDAPRATPEVLRQTADRIGQVFDDVTQGLDITPSPQMVAAMAGADDTYRALAPTTNQSPIIGQVADAVADAATNGTTIPAATVRVWRSRLSKLTTSADEATRTAAREALEAVDDAFGDALTAAGRTADIARLAEARTHWRNFLAIQKAASGAGEGAAAGVLSPSALRSAVATQGRAAYAQGKRGDLGDLVRAAEGVMKKLPTSGTAENLRAMLGPGAAFGGLGAAVGSGAGPLGAAAGAMAGAALPAVAGAVRMSRPVQAYLANQLARPGGNALDPRTMSGLIPLLTGEQRNALAR